MGTANLPKIFIDAESEIPSASKWNGNFDYLNFTPASIIRNGDFELGFTAGVPQSWTLSGAGATSVQDADSKRAASAVKLSFGTAAAVLKQTANETKFFKGRKVKSWCWVKSSTPNIARIRVFDGVGSTDSAFHTGGGQYELLIVTHLVAAGATTLDMELKVEGAGNALFDAAVLTDFETALGFLPFLAQGTTGDFQTVKLSAEADEANELGKGLIPKAWVKFVGATGVISADQGVASVAKTATGVYTITFDRNFLDANYVMAGSVFNAVGADGFVRMGNAAPAVGSCEVRTVADNGLATDFNAVMLVFFGNQ